MCIIIVKQKGNKVPMQTLKNSARINQHGLGIIWLDTYSVEYHKSNDYKLLDTSRPYIAHFRYATKGAINLENTHPFNCGKFSDEFLFHNGTIKAMETTRLAIAKHQHENQAVYQEQNGKTSQVSMNQDLFLLIQETERFKSTTETFGLTKTTFGILKQM